MTKTMTIPFAAPPAELPFARYGRTSRLGGRDAAENVSRSEQFRHVDQIAGRFELPTTDREFYDADASGSTFDRPQWEAIVQGVRDGKLAGAVAFDLKRISRGKTAEVLAMVEDMESVGGRLYDGTGRVSVDDADAELMTTVKAMIARREWRERRAYLVGSVANAIRNGQHLTAPFGYAKGASKRLVIVEAEAKAVARAFELRDAGWSWSRIAAELNTICMPRMFKRDGQTLQRPWTHKSVRQLVMNKVYTGTAWNGKLEHQDAHPAIVTRELFDRVNRRRGVKPVGPSDGYMLTGLVRCHSCGYVMNHDPAGYYRCQRDACTAPSSANVAQVHALAAAAFKSEYMDLELTAAVDNDELTAADAAVSQAKAQITGLASLASTLADMLPEERAIFEDQMIAARAALRAAITDQRTAQLAARGADLPAELDADGFDSAPVADQRLFLSTVFACVVVRPSARYREPVADRSVIVGRDQAPTNGTDLIVFARSVNL